MRNDSAKLLVIMGSSGSGKTTLAKALIAGARTLFDQPIEICPIVSYTSREARTDDLPAEYRYVTKPELWEMQARDELAWLVPKDALPHDTLYGTRTEDLLTPLGRPGTLGIATVMPETLPDLCDTLADAGHADDWLPIYIERPTESKLRARLSPERFIEMSSRWKNESGWELLAAEHARNLTFVTNEGTVEELVAQVRLLLSR